MWLNGKESACQFRRHKRWRFNFWVGKIPWRRDWLPTPVFLGFPGGSAGKESTCNAGDLGLIPGLGRSPGEGKGYPSSILAWRIPWTVIIHGAAESDTTEQFSLSLRTKKVKQQFLEKCLKYVCFNMFNF